MPKVGDMAGTVDEVLALAVEWYAHPVPPPIFASVDPRVLRKALRLADGVWGRLEVIRWDEVLVHNRPVW